MVWVRSEYAGELAVALTWLSALVPWNVTFTAQLGGASVLFLRWPLFQVRYVWGLPLVRGTLVTLPVPAWLLPASLQGLSALALQEGQTILLAYQVWALGAAVFAVAVGFSVVYYLREARVEALSVDPVRIVGLLLTLTGGVLAVATYFLVTRGFPGIPVPVGVVFLLVFGAILLTVKRTVTPADVAGTDENDRRTA